MRGDTAKVNGKAIRDLRVQQEWTQQELARRIGCGKRLVQKLEAGGSAKLETIKEFAEALGVNSDNIRYNGQSHDTVKAPIINLEPLPDVLMQSVWVIARNIDEVDEKYLAEYLNHFRTKSGIKGSIKIISVSEGSVIAALEMSAEDTINALEAFCLGKFDELDIMEVNLPFSSGISEAVYDTFQFMCYHDIDLGKQINALRVSLISQGVILRHPSLKDRSDEVVLAIKILQTYYKNLDNEIELIVNKDSINISRVGIHVTAT